MSPALVNFAYLTASVLFVMGLKGLSHPRTAVRGNFLGALAMLLAIVVTLVDKSILSFEWIAGGAALGALIGAVLAQKIRMTAMPQLVALLNGFGGIASVLVAGAALEESSELLAHPHESAALQFSISVAFSGLIGAITFWGSLMAFVKLEEMIPWKVMEKIESLPGANYLNLGLLLGAIGVSAYFVNLPGITYYWILAGIASVLGVLLVVPIGGADMPVVISLLNAYSGLAAAATGFVLSNNVLIIAGSLVGASGVILSQIMCKAMNRSLANVLFGGVLSGGGGKSRADADKVYAGKVKSASADEIAILFDTARRVVFVPGYGMAVSQAQHSVRDLTTLLEQKGINVEFAIHPVAGRMPGHMNVLLAEADIPYEKQLAMDDINPTFPETDIAIVIGANDVVNPVAREDPKSPIAGMPILDVDKARTVVIIKRSLSPGFAGIPNPLFAADNTLMLFGDGKAAVLDLIRAVKEG
jgi:proton-translocating NAD(P)+ transhydrogenase subunit beta